MRLYLIRHADPDYANHTITAPGHLEARSLAERLSQEGIDHIYCSPLGRALHTMQYTAERTGIEPVILPWLSELQDWHIKDDTGAERVAWNVDGEFIRGSKPYPTCEDWHLRAPFTEGGDYRGKFETIRQESDRLFEQHGYRRKDGTYEIERSNPIKIAAFCHMGFGLAWLAHLLELPLPMVWSGFWLAPSSVTTVLWDERTMRTAVPRCIGLSDVSHLYASKLPISTQGIIANVV